MVEVKNEQVEQADAARDERYRRHDVATIRLTITLVVAAGLWCLVEAAFNWSGPEGPSDGLLTTVAQVDVGLLIAIAVEGGRSRWTRRGAGFTALSLGLAILGLIQKYDFVALAAIALLFLGVVCLIAMTLRHYTRAAVAAARAAKG